jgi:molecular chaperone GrpE
MTDHMRRFFRRMWSRPEPTMSESAQPAPESTANSDADAKAAEAAAAASGSEPLTITVGEFEALKREVQEWKERCLRNQAEFDNVRKRLRKEADEAGARAVVRAIRPILNELDNLARAVEVATPETFADFAQGVTLIRENLRGALAGQGIEMVPAEGIFDPAFHEVIAEVEHPELPKGTITQVHRQGWKLKDQLVRSAQVVVAKPVAAPAP